MILDNETTKNKDGENESRKVHEWITKYTAKGELDIVTGYFTLGALAFLSQQLKEKISKFRLVLGDIVNKNTTNFRTLDLLNENITVEAALRLKKVAQEAVDFLKLDKVEAKTLEPNFCHAKAYIFKPETKDKRYYYYISGSSNLTEAGIGLKKTNNIELNIAETGDNNQYIELAKWFDDLWTKKQAHKEKTLIDENGKKYKKPFKQYLIEEIGKIFDKYTPKELYYKVLFELFGSQILDLQNDPEFAKQVGRLENSVVFNTLYDFQQKGVLSIIKMLQKYNGAILADAVGLGKTWSALAVMKFFQLQGREIILLCPKKLQYNWSRYRKNQDSKFERDKLEYFIRFHTDLHPDRIDKDKYKEELADTRFIDDKPKLFVIDESHNLRNDKSKRYKFLVDEILKKNEDVKVLMLSATPINNTLNDIRNQFKLMVRGDVYGFKESLGVRNIDYTFRSAQKSFNIWREKSNPQIGEFIKELPANFFTLTDSLIVARTRSMIEGQQTGLVFPEKDKPDNIFVTPKELGNFESFEELFEHFPPMLSGYQPAFYAESMEEKKNRQKAKKEGKTEISVIEDEVQRDRFLVKMMYILMVKRLESSWFSFKSTVNKILDHHQNALNRIKAYENNKKNIELNDEIDVFDSDELKDEIEEFTLGKKRKINLSDIDNAGNLEWYKKDLKKDIEALDNLLGNLNRFASDLDKETIRPNNHKSIDDKLQVLIERIVVKRKAGANDNNQKVVVFTVYKDTAEYLFDQLKSRGFDKIALVSGTGSKTGESDIEHTNFEPILERFAPYTKLFKEKEWKFEPSSEIISEKQQYEEWINWIAENDKKTYEKIQNPIDILIATDALSEGQNLQDADLVVNYDIHWNPVRIIQRMGRIDRLGSPNKNIFGINFWPSNNINSYLNLQNRIEHRMAAMKLAGSEVQLEFSDTFKTMAEDDNLENKMKARMLKQMETTFDDLDGEKSFGFDDLSLEQYRQELLAELNQNRKKYLDMPKGVYTGFVADKNICKEKGIIALLGYPAKPAKTINFDYQYYNLIYIDKNGVPVLLNQKEILDALTLHKDEERYVPPEIDNGEENAIQELVLSINKWMKSQAVEEKRLDDGTIKEEMGKEPLDLISKLKQGDKNAVKRIKQNEKSDDKYQLTNFDLIAWFLVN